MSNKKEKITVELIEDLTRKCIWLNDNSMRVAGLLAANLDFMYAYIKQERRVKAVALLREVQETHKKVDEGLCKILESFSTPVTEGQKKIRESLTILNKNEQ